MPQGAFNHIRMFHRLPRYGFLVAIAQRARPVLQLQPFTVRGALGLLLSMIVFFQFALPLNDLVASMLGGGLSLLVLSALIGTVTGVLRVKGKLQISHRMESLELVSHSRLGALLQLQGVNLLPFTRIRIKRRFEFDDGSVASTEHVLSGAQSNSATTIRDSVIFPHRGLWNLVSIDVALGDTFGFTEIGWSVPVHDPISIDAPTVPIRPLSILASSSRSGDEISLTRERTGDPFDLKAYDPSDGINRILWKTFARSGELVVRRPEPAVVPEGEIAVFVVASTTEDEVAGAFQDYYRQLLAQNIVALVSVDGAPNHGLETDDRKVRDELNAAAWNPRAGSGDDLPRFVGEVHRRNPYLVHVVVFCSSERYQNLAAQLQQLSLTASLAIVPPHFRKIFGARSEGRTSPERILGMGDLPGINLHLCEFGGS